jgi:integrase/recombinase XerD
VSDAERSAPGSASDDVPLPAEALVFLRHLRAERGLATATIEAYGRDLRRYATYLAERGLDLAAVTAEDVEAFVVWLRESRRPDGGPYAERSLGRTVVAVRGLHRFLRVDGGAAHDPAAGVAAPAAGRSLPKALSEADVVRLLDAAPSSTPAGLRDRAALELLYGAGLRISELTGLDVDDVDLVDRMVLVRGKGDRQRIVPFGGPAADAVERWLTTGRPVLGPRSPALLLNLRGGRLSRQGLWRIIRERAEQAGVAAHVTPHTLRHSFATHLLDGGADVRAVQELLGHASVTTTQIYTLVSRGAMRRAYEQAHPRA